MTTLHEAAQAVLARWDSPAWEWLKQGPTAALMADLRAALEVDDGMYGAKALTKAYENGWNAAKAEPVQEHPVCDECGKSKSDGWALYCVGCVEPMFVLKAEPVQEPVAWSHINGTSDTKWHPPQRKPLTGEQLKQLELSLRVYSDNDRYDLSLHDFARAIEQAHGIAE